jgi:hypothetical protein
LRPCFIPLALMGFTLQSVPPGSSTVLLSRLVPSWAPVDLPSLYSKAYSEKYTSKIQTRQPDVTALTDSATQQTSYQKVLIHSQVRSHPAPVLPVAGGRYSHGVVVPSRENGRKIPTQRLSSHVLTRICKQSHAALQSIENHPVGFKPEGLNHPL